MRITLVNRYFYPDQSATSRMVSSLAFALAGKGFPVRVVTSRSHYESGGASLPSRENIRGVDVHRLRMSGFGRRNLAGRSADYATFHLLVGVWLLGNARRGDICVVCTDPPLLSGTAVLPLKLRGAQLVNWIMDLFPEVAMELGVMPKAGILARSTLALRDWSHRAANLTMCPIEAMTRYLVARTGGTGDIVTVRLWPMTTKSDLWSRAQTGSADNGACRIPLWWAIPGISDGRTSSPHFLPPPTGSGTRTCGF